MTAVSLSVGLFCLHSLGAANSLSIIHLSWGFFGISGDSGATPSDTWPTWIGVNQPSVTSLSISAPADSASGLQ